MTTLRHATLALLLAACGGTTESAGGGGASPGRGGSGSEAGDLAADAGPGMGESAPLSVAVIVHPATGLAYASMPDDGVRAVRVRDGSVVWTSAEADRPLVASSEVVVAQRAVGDPAHVVRLAILRASDGVLHAQSDAITLPRWVVPRPWFNGAVYAFDSEAFIEGDRTLFRWRAERNPICGGTPESGCSGEREIAMGAVWVTLADGSVEPAPEPRAFGAPPDPPAVAQLAGQLASFYLPFARTVIDGELVSTTLREEGGRKILALARFDAETGAPVSSLDLTAADADEAAYSSNVPRFSVDNRHVVITRLRMTPPPPIYLRAVHEVETGRLLANVEIGSPPRPYVEPFVVAGDVLVQVDRAGPEYDRDRSAALVGLGVTDGAERFRVALRSVRGHSQPPSAAPGVDG